MDIDVGLALPKQSGQRQARRQNINPADDREFPLGSMELKRFNAEQDADISKATVHIGPYADELARSFGALAVTIGEDIFFRGNAYKPGSEEGDKTAAHELMHVAQFTEGRIASGATVEELEAEAVRAEGLTAFDGDSIVTINLNGNNYSFPKSKMRYYARVAAKAVREWLESQRDVLSEREYFKLLLSYEKWLWRES